MIWFQSLKGRSILSDPPLAQLDDIAKKFQSLKGRSILSDVATYVWDNEYNEVSIPQRAEHPFGRVPMLACVIFVSRFNPSKGGASFRTALQAQMQLAQMQFQSLKGRSILSDLLGRRFC